MQNKCDRILTGLLLALGIASFSAESIAAPSTEDQSFAATLLEAEKGSATAQFELGRLYARIQDYDNGSQAGCNNSQSAS